MEHAQRLTLAEMREFVASTSYVVSRQGGFSPEDSAGAVVEMATSVYTVIE